MAQGTNLPSLTGLRWPAAFLVFAFHLTTVGYLPAEGLSRRLFGAGAVGVSFFFILSGFVLMWSSAREGPGEFWWRRFARVYPLHLVTAVAALVIGLRREGREVPEPSILLANLTLTQSWSPDEAYFQSLNPVSWTLSCEVFFYLVFPLLAAGAVRLRTDALLLTMLGAWLVTVAVPLVGGRTVWFFHWTPAGRLPEFACGVALACMVRRAGPRRPNLAGLWCGAAVLTVAGYGFAGYVPEPWNVAAYTLPGFALLLAAAALSDIRGRWTPWRNRVTVRLGELSYAFYLVHLLVLRSLRDHLGDRLLSGAQGLAMAVDALVLSLAAACLLNVGVERPARRLLLRRSRRVGS